MAGLVGQMLCHLELRVTVLHMADQVEEQTRAAQFGVPIDAENQNLLIDSRHSAVFRHLTRIHLLFCSSAHAPCYSAREAVAKAMQFLTFRQTDSATGGKQSGS